MLRGRLQWLQVFIETEGDVELAGVAVVNTGLALLVTIVLHRQPVQTLTEMDLAGLAQTLHGVV